MNKIIIVPKKVILIKRNPIKHFFKCDDEFTFKNFRFWIHVEKYNPKGQRLHIQIWMPFIHIERDNIKWEIGNKYRLHIYHQGE